MGVRDKIIEEYERQGFVHVLSIREGNETEHLKLANYPVGICGGCGNDVRVNEAMLFGNESAEEKKVLGYHCTCWNSFYTHD